MDKRPNTKGLVSRTFRITVVSVRIISARTESMRTAEITVIDTHGDPIKQARSTVRLNAGEMILRAEVKSDRKAVITQSPEEFIHYGREVEYINIPEGEQEQ